MSDDELKTVAASAIYSLFNSRKLCAPISAMELLTSVMTFKSLTPNGPGSVRFRLTDISRFESILQTLSQAWEKGTISLSRENGALTVMEVNLDSPVHDRASLGESLSPRKRKRVIDEEADSAAGDEEDEVPSFDDYSNSLASSSKLGGLTKELRSTLR